MQVDCGFVKNYNVVYLGKADNHFISAKTQPFNFIKRNIIQKLAYKVKSWMLNSEGLATYNKEDCYKTVR